jgi:nucleoid DNA-binding protein
MTKTELIAKVAEKLGVSKKLAGEFVNTFTSVVIE